MLEALIFIALAACGLGLMATMRLWSVKSGQSVTAFAYFFGLWIVSTAVWNTFFMSFPLPGLFDISIDRALFFLLVGMALFQFFLKRVDIRANHRIELAMFIFCLVCIESMSMHGFSAEYSTYTKPLYLFLFGYLAPFCSFLFAKYFITNEKSFRFILGSIFLLGVYLCITAIFERNGMKEFIFPRYITDEITYTMHLDRARGPFLNAAFNGVGMTFGFISGVLLLCRTVLWKRIAILLMLTLYIPGIFYTHTRSIYLMFMYCLIALLFFYNTRTPKWKYIPLILFVGVSLVIANAGTIFSGSREGGGIAQMEEVAIRFQLIERSQQLFFTDPLFGVGLAKFAVAESSPELFHEQQHNHFIGLAVELGLVGMFSYLCIMFLIFKRVYGIVSNPANNTVATMNVAIMLALGISVNIINNTFLEPSYCPFVMIMTFTFAGFIDRMYQTPSLLHAVSGQA